MGNLRGTARPVRGMKHLINAVRIEVEGRKFRLTLPEGLTVEDLIKILEVKEIEISELI